MATVQCKSRQAATPGKKEATVIAVEGIINSETLPDFQAATKAPLERGAARLIFDLKNLGYINSSGLGEFIRCLDVTRGRGGEIALVAVPQEIIRTIKIIGFHTLIKIFPDEKSALAYFDSGSAEAVAKEYARVAPKPPPSRVERKPVPHKERFPARPPEAAVMLVMPKKDVFADILALRWGRNGPEAKFSHISDRHQALKNITQARPDLMIIDNTVRDADDLCGEIKMKRESSMVSVIKVYAREQAHRPDFVIREDDRVFEPFEYNELFAVAESELRRVATRDKFVTHRMQFEFANTEREIERANDLIAQLVRQTDLNEHDASELRTACREAIDNAYRHGNLCQAARRMWVEYRLDFEKVTVLVGDDGKGFDYTFYLSLGKESDPQERARMRQREGKPGGLGIMLMMRCLAALEYDDPGNVCRLVKKLS